MNLIKNLLGHITLENYQKNSYSTCHESKYSNEQFTVIGVFKVLTKEKRTHWITIMVEISLANKVFVPSDISSGAYHHASNIICTLASNMIVDSSVVFRVSPVGSFST